MSYPPCAGVIVFNGDLTILVQTDALRYSFPKGKRNKKETPIETAWRELKEETGLNAENVQLISDTYYIDEVSCKGFPSVRYYVGRLIKDLPKSQFDPTELRKVEWIEVENAMMLERFEDRRKEILKIAYAKINSFSSPSST